MTVRERFIRYIQEQGLCQPHERVLLAVSGGKDSVMMASLFAETGYTIGLAHCNFRLRGGESDADEAFVCQLAETLGAPFFVTGFDTSAYAQAQGISIQMAARDLRYRWLEDIRSSQGYDRIAVAQHQNDHMETLLLNLVRGTGLAGLRGIQPRRGPIIRPLLFLRAEEVQAFVQEHGLVYRDDASNFSTKYARNKIRLAVIPTLRELNTDLEQTMAANIGRFTDAYTVLQQHIGALREGLLARRGAHEWHVSLDALMGLHPRRFLWYELFRPFGFSEAVLNDLERSIAGIPGKQFRSTTHVAFLDRTELVLQPIKTVDHGTVTIAGAGQTVQWGGFQFESGYTADSVIDDVASVAQFDGDRVIFPIQIRTWKEGDVFQPLGMRGRKKLSDFFVALKIPIYRKRQVPVVVNGNGDIIWVAPYRMDDRYKITGKTKKVFTLACF